METSDMAVVVTPAPAPSPEPMNAREAITGFVAWLTVQDTQHVFGTAIDAGHAAGLVEAFCATNELPACRDGWEHHLTHPPQMDGNGPAAADDRKERS